MTLLVPNVGEVFNLNGFLNQNLSLKLYSNDVIPAYTDIFSTYNEVTGGGYVDFDFVFANWTIGVTGIATYAAQDFHFTGVTGAPGTIYGYYVVNDSNTLLWAERFPENVLPFTPQNNYFIRITPRIQVV